MFQLSISLIPYSYGVEVFHFSLDLYTNSSTPWTSDRPVARPLQHKHRIRTHIHTPMVHALSWIRTHDHGVRASEDGSCIRTLRYRDCNTFC
jgi:hypothetical protein